MDTSVYAELFRSGAEEQLSRIEGALEALQHNPGDRRSHERLLLGLHTLKGEANIAGLPAIAELAHVAEDVLSRVKEGSTVLAAPTAHLLARAAAVVRCMLAAPGSAADRIGADMVAELRDWAPGRLSEEISPATVNERRALVVDESATMCELHATMLRDAGFNVDRATSGDEALTRAQRVRYDVVIAGIQLRGLSGLQLAAALSSPSGSLYTPVILTSLDEGLDLRERALAAGAAAFLPKRGAGDKQLASLALLLAEGARR